jgi:caa(3)-type oxidase subunit IV
MSASVASHDTHGSHGSGDHGHSHGHVIVPPITLGTILGLLLFFTLLTVGVAQLEVWIMDYFNIVLPGWINIVGAMIIATVKCVLVMAFFMQLRYDNPINTIVMLFTILCVALFLVFTSLDLLTRDRVYADKGKQVIPGGSGDGTNSFATIAKKKYEDKWGAEKFAAIKSVIKHDSHGHGHGGHEASNTASRSRTVTGLTGALSTSVGAHGHDAKHDGKHDAKHDGHDHAKPEAKPEAKPAGAH